VNGTFRINACGKCAAPGEAPTCFDCTGTPNGTVVRDVCGNCPASTDCDPSFLIQAYSTVQMNKWIWVLIGVVGGVGALCCLAAVFSVRRFIASQEK